MCSVRVDFSRLHFHLNSSLCRGGRDLYSTTPALLSKVDERDATIKSSIVVGSNTEYRNGLRVYAIHCYLDCTTTTQCNKTIFCVAVTNTDQIILGNQYSVFVFEQPWDGMWSVLTI